jgi:hypothetical protein
MGNFQTGVTNEGMLQNIKCEDCNKVFEGYVNKVTIKGPTPDPIRCEECHHLWNIKMYDNLRYSFGKINDRNDHKDNTNDGEAPHISINEADVNILPVLESSVSPQYEITLHYAKWCHFSREMLPEWKIFEDYASTYFKNLKVIRMCYEGSEKPSNPKIKGYPTIILTVPDNTFVIFDYDRKVEFFIKFVKENMRI